MGFDGGYLRKVSQELSALEGARVDRIGQPSRECLVLTLRGAGTRRVLITAGGPAPKLHLTETPMENPASPPMFCMLLRKKLGGGRFLGARQMGMDRLISLDFSSYNELGDAVSLSLVCELLGRGANAVLVQDGKIVDALRRVDLVANEKRQVLPGIAYVPPAPQAKADVTLLSAGEAASLVLGGRDVPLSRGIMEQLQGISPVVARELSFRACGPRDPAVTELSAAERDALRGAFAALREALAPGGGAPTVVLGGGGLGQEGQPWDFSYLPLTQYEGVCPLQARESFSALLDDFFREKDAGEGVSRRKTALRRALAVVRDRDARKLAARLDERARSEDRDRLRRCGDLLSANLWQLKKGERSATLPDFYDPAGGSVTIPLDPRLSPSGNVQKYYADYRRAANAAAMLDGLIESCRQELAYVEAEMELLQRATQTSELDAIASELAAQGVLRAEKPKGGKPARTAALPPLAYLTDDGFSVLCGRSGAQNDRLTHKTARPGDLWLHLQKAPGSHVIVLSGGRPIPARTVEQAAVIAACQSSARGGAKAAVDYTDVKNVRKPAGAKPGFVIYDSYSTAWVLPDPALAQRLRERAEAQKGAGGAGP